MDEDSIVTALQSDLQNYKVKTQIRRKESQLHVLITRAEGEQPDYDSLYDIVKRRIDRMGIDGVDTLVVYGRLAKEKHPEWQQTAAIKPPLPLIELDLDELEDFGDLSDLGDLGGLTLPSDADSLDIKLGSFDPSEPDRFDTFDSFEKSLEKDLQRTGQLSDRPKTEDFDLGELDLGEFQLDNLKQSRDFDLGELDSDSFDLGSSVSAKRSPQASKANSNGNGNHGNSWRDEDFSLDETTVAMPMPLPPPLPPTKRLVSKPVPEPESPPEPELTEETESKRNTWLISGAFVAVAIAVMGICGWVLLDRSAQQKYLEAAQRFDNQTLNPQKVTKLEELTETRNQLQTIVSQLDEIPNRPASLYSEAQAELGNLRPKLADFDRKIELEQAANKKVESAKMLTLEAAKLVQSPPHRSTVWKSAQEKRQQALKLLEEVTPESLLYPNAQTLLKTYRNELVQISKWVEIQQRAETVVPNVNANTVTLLKQLKTKAPDKQKYLPQCKVILQPQILNADAQRTGIAIPLLSDYLCAYFWSL